MKTEGNRWRQASSHTATSGSGGRWQLGWAPISNLTVRSRRRETQALSQLYKKAGADTKGESPPGPALMENGGHRVPVALERIPGLTDRGKAMRSDESPGRRTQRLLQVPLSTHPPAHAHTPQTPSQQVPFCVAHVSTFTSSHIPISLHLHSP